MTTPAPPPAAGPASARQQILRTWRIWQPIALIALFAAFGGPRAWLPAFQILIVVAATVPLVLGRRSIDSAGLAEPAAGRLRRLLWALSAPLYLVAVVLFFVR